jgi:hypothetical protein
MAEQILRAAAEPNEEGLPLDLMVFPVCYGAMGDEDARLLSIAASRTGCYVVWGSVNEQGESDVWLLRPDGRVDRHPSADSAPARAQVFELPWGRIGLTLAEDLLDPEVVRALAFSGADVIAVPADWPEGSPRWLWAVRWMENETPLVVANREGGSRIWHNHRPRPEAGRGYDSVIGATVVVGGAKEGFNHLRPKWYKALSPAEKVCHNTRHPTFSTDGGIRDL